MNIIKFLNIFFKYSLIPVIIICAILLLLFQSPHSKDIEIEYSKITLETKQEFEDISGKSLFLSDLHIDVSLPDLKSNIEVYSKDYRPDIKNKAVFYDICIKPNDSIITVRENQKINIQEKNGYFSISPNSTNFWLEIQKSRKDFVKIKICAKIDDNSIADEVLSDFFEKEVLEPKPNEDKSYMDCPHLKALAEAKWVSEDLFVKLYYKGKKSQNRLVLEDDIIYVADDELLIYKDNKWQTALDVDTSQYDLVCIKAVDTKILELTIFTQGSDKKYNFVYTKDDKGEFNHNKEELITTLKRRTQKHVSATINKQRVVLKEKDVLVKKDNRWKLLKKDFDDDYLRNNEILFFERIKENKFKKIAIFHLFNQNHNKSIQIDVPIISSQDSSNIKIRRGLKS